MAKKAKMDNTGDQALDAVEKALSIDFDDEELELSSAELDEIESRITDAAQDIADGESAAAGKPDDAQDPAVSKPMSPSERLGAVTGTDNKVEAELPPEIPPEPANDEYDNELAGFLYSIQQKPKSRMYLFAGLFSVLWLALCTYYFVQNVMPAIAGTENLQSALLQSTFLTFAAVTLIPLLLVWAFAALMKRAQEMRHAAGSMTEAAIRLLQPENVAVDSVATVGRSVRREVAAIGDGVERAIARAGELELLVQREIMNLERSYDDSEMKIRRLVDDISTEREEIVSHGEKLRNSITDTHTGLTAEMELAGNRIEDQARQATEQLVSLLDNRSQDLVTSIEQTKDNLANSIEEGRMNLTTSVEQSRENLTSFFSSASQDFDSRINAGKSALEQSIGLKGDELSSLISSTGEAVATLLDTHTVRFGETGANIAAIFQNKSDEFERIGDKVAQQIEDNFSIRSTEFSSRLADAGEAIQQGLETRLDSIDEHLNTRGNSLVDALNARSEALDKVLQDRTDGIGKTIAERLSGFGQSLTGHVDESVRQLKEQTEVLQENTKSVEAIIAKRAGDVETAVKKSTIEFARAVEESIEEVDQKSSAINSTLLNTTENLSQKLQENTESLTSQITQSAHLLGETLDNKTAEASASLSQSLDKLDERLSASSLDIESRFEEAGKAIDDKSEKLGNLLTDRANVIKSTLGDTLVETQRSLEEKTQELNNLFRARSEELSNIIENDAKPVAATIEQAGDAAREKILSVTGSLADEASTLFAKIGESSDLLGKLIVSAQDNLSSVQTELATQSESYAQTVEDAKSRMEQSTGLVSGLQDKFEGATESAVQNLSHIASRYEEQSHMLQEVTKLIDASQSELEATLDSRQQSLRDLASGLVSRTDEINKTMSAFGQMVTSMVDEVNEKSRGVSGSLSAEISSAIDDATARFNDAVEAMRGAAQEMRSELEETRSEMRKGILELPEETQQNAAAMRRVVTDQIAALRDLSELVHKSGMMLDAKAPAQTAQPASQPSAPQPSFLRPVAKPAAAAAPAQPHIPGTELRGSTSPAAAATASSAQPVPAPPASNTQSPGWVSDLLRRASQEESRPQGAPPVNTPNTNTADRSPLHVVESLNSLSMDIARAIDHEAVVQLWDRYQHGERNVFTRRLYTLQGQQTFEEIRNKYQREPEFRQAVDRYIQDFEKLLEDVSRNDRDNMMTQTYLTSDTGKVYTMLAHASGRLGNE